MKIYSRKSIVAMLKRILVLIFSDTENCQRYYLENRRWGKTCKRKQTKGDIGSDAKKERSKDAPRCPVVQPGGGTGQKILHSGVLGAVKGRNEEWSTERGRTVSWGHGKGGKEE